MDVWTFHLFCTTVHILKNMCYRPMWLLLLLLLLFLFLYYYLHPHAHAHTHSHTYKFNCVLIYKLTFYIFLIFIFKNFCRFLINFHSYLRVVNYIWSGNIFVVILSCVILTIKITVTFRRKHHFVLPSSEFNFPLF